MKCSVVLIALVSIMLLAAVNSSYADVPHMINYQGRLTDDQGDPVNATVSIVFTIYDDSTGDNSKWTETNPSVTVTDGLFSVLLGSIVPLVDTVFSDPERYLGIAVNGDPEITPRTRLVSVGYSHRVSTVDGTTGGVISGDVSIQSDLSVSGKATIGPGNTNTGTEAFVAGSSNEASGNYTTVGGGADNTVAGNYSTIAGGQGNSTGGYYNSVGGGDRNRTAGNHSTVPGGKQNRVSGEYSFTTGYADTVMAAYSYLFGINSDLAQDSTFMVDLPHIRFGDTASGYEFPTEDGGVSQVLATDGSGQVGWTSVSGTTDADWAISGDDMYSGVSGNVGIGTTSPVAKLEVSSLMRLTPTDTPGTCDGTVNGSIYYDESRGELCYCNGITWMQVDGGGPCGDECVDGDSDGYDTCDPSNPNDTDGLDADCDDENYDINPGATELCDGIDNNCNDETDEGNPEGGGDCGPCNDGVLTCIGGVLECVGGSDPEPEICDDVDNNCDGEIDEGCISAGDLVITEIMPDPAAVEDPYGEYIEIYNVSSQTINLNGFILKDNGGQEITINENVYVSAGSYATLGADAAGFEPDYVWDAEAFNLSNTGDEIILEVTGMVVDAVYYTGSWPFSSGYSMVLDDSAYDATSNDNSSNWCTSTSTYGSGDYGTPGAANDDCF